jgi:hypothetical protein
MVVEVKTKIRKWGGSWGGTLPKKQLEAAHYKPGDFIRLLILPKECPLKGMFGIMKFSKPVKEILKEVDKEGWDE